MAEDALKFSLASAWVGKSTGDGSFDLGSGARLEYGLDATLGGRSGRTNPEELLLAAVTSCYTITLAVLVERRSIPVTRIDVAAEATVARQPGGTLKYESISLQTKIAATGIDDSQRTAIMQFADKAERYCPISIALRDNVEVTVHAEIV